MPLVHTMDRKTQVKMSKSESRWVSVQRNLSTEMLSEKTQVAEGNSKKTCRQNGETMQNNTIYCSQSINKRVGDRISKFRLFDFSGGYLCICAIILNTFFLLSTFIQTEKLKDLSCERSYLCYLAQRTDCCIYLPHTYPFPHILGTFWYVRTIL